MASVPPLTGSAAALSQYQQAVSNLVKTLKENSFLLNTTKTKGLCRSGRNKEITSLFQPLCIQGQLVERVQPF